ncbi:alpha/beta hydrolase [Agromyces mediolanus]|uniref:alpha/beta fold hydrolase n=1 Tax=Agromyces mediolanus TaxID=41986 RepID=UPI003833DCEA
MARARVVLVHGIRTSATMWRAQLDALARHDVEAVAVDLPGHGSRIGEPFTLDAAIGTIADALRPDSLDAGPLRPDSHRADALRPDSLRGDTTSDGDATPGGGDGPAAPRSPTPRLLVGLSLGGYLAVEAAARHPVLLDGLVAASCGTRPRGVGLRGYLALADAIGRLPDRGRRLNDGFVRLMLSPAAARDVVAGGVALDVMRPALTAVGTIDLEASLRAVRCPVWLVNGRLDHFRLEERRLAGAVADGRLVVVPGATHLVSLSRPEAFTAVVLDAVAELERRAAVRPRSPRSDRSGR